MKLHPPSPSLLGLLSPEADSYSFPPANCVKAKIHYTMQFPRNKLALVKVRCVCCVVSFPKFHYNDLLPTCCGLVGRVANKSATSPQQVGNFPVYGQVTGKRV